MREGQEGLLIVRTIDIISFLVFHFIATSPAICGLAAALLFAIIYLPLFVFPNLAAVISSWAVFVY